MELHGLTENQVVENRSKYGSNSLSKKESESFLSKLIEGFKDKMIIILLVALVINLVFVFLGEAEWYESLGIAVAIFIANFVSVYSEHKNETTFQELQDEASRIKTKVYRSGKLIETFIDQLVVGDLVLLQSGDKIPADGKLIKGQIKVDQSTLNGESKEATKTFISINDLGDTDDLLNPYYVYRDTVVCNGEGVMEIMAVGDNSMYGKLALELQDETRESPLKVKLGDLADKISLFGYIGAIVIAIAYMFQSICLDSNFDPALMIGIVTNLKELVHIIINSVVLSVTIIVMAVPEGLPMMIALVLSMNMGKMLKDNVLVRKINGIETAGGINILFSDKTGTITEGRLSVVEFALGNVKVFDQVRNLDSTLKNHLIFGIGINNSSSFNKTEKNIIGGNSTDRALLKYLVDNTEIDDTYRDYITEINPFNSDVKMSTVKVQIGVDKPVEYIKGAPEKIVSECSKYISETGEVRELNQSIIDSYIDHQANKAMRLIAVAIRTEKETILIGILSIRDNVRKEAVTAIKQVQDAGVHVVMVTGDRKETAMAIAKEAGLLTGESDICLTSTELNEKTDDELKELLPKLKVVARALPIDKSRLVRIAQELGLVVAMTGDGVNDSPALKKADVGFAMGSGTDVAKEAGDIVILDDNFKSIVQAILYGRTIFKSIRKFIIFQLTVNVSAVLLSFFGPLLGIHEPLTIIQILWINLIMDTLSALAFGGEPPLERYLKEKPISRKANIVSKYMISEILTAGTFIFAVSIALNFVLKVDQLHIYTMMFTYFIFATIFNAFNARTDSINLFEHISENKNFVIVMGLVALIQVIMIQYGGSLLRTTPLEMNQWILVISLAVLIIPIDLFRKVLIRKNPSL